MFGYVKPHIPDLRVKEYNFYRQTYCGLCRELKKISRIMPFTLSYDFTFLALCRMAAENDGISFSTCRCAARPFKKHCYVCAEGSLRYCAEASALLTAEKLRDDMNDSHGIKQLFAGSAYKKMKRILRKIRQPLPSEAVKIELEKLSDSENALCESVYDGAEHFGALLAEIFSFGLSDEIKSDLYNIGYAVGRWIYIIDAYSDIKDDLKSGSYNPFILSGSNSDDPDFKKKISDALSYEIASTIPTTNRLLASADKGIAEIIKNILYVGMPVVANDVIYKNRKIKDKEDIPDERSI